jgi:hypothetical protein
MIFSTQLHDSHERREEGLGVMTLPPRRTFVVKISAEADPVHVVGRVEHVTSGNSARFEAIDELGAFIAEILGQEQSPATPKQGEVE